MYFRSRALGFRCKTQPAINKQHMAYSKDIVERLSLFNNLSFTKKQWDIILKGCGCPKSSHFWAALKTYNLQKNHRMFTLVDINAESFDKVWTLYCKSNRASVKKAYDKGKARKQARERRDNFKGVTLYLVEGYLTEIKPTRDEH